MKQHASVHSFNYCLLLFFPSFFFFFFFFFVFEREKVRQLDHAERIRSRACTHLEQIDGEFGARCHLSAPLGPRSSPGSSEHAREGVEEEDDPDAVQVREEALGSSSSTRHQKFNINLTVSLWYDEVPYELDHNFRIFIFLTSTKNKGMLNVATSASSKAMHATSTSFA
jgi:hypothetical protein